MKDIKNFIKEALNDDNNEWSNAMGVVISKIEKMCGFKLGTPEDCDDINTGSGVTEGVCCEVEGLGEEIMISVLFDKTGNFVFMVDDGGEIEMFKPGEGTLNYEGISWGKYNVDDPKSQKLFSKTSLTKFAEENEL